jgi:hypothetical protein
VTLPWIWGTVSNMRSSTGHPSAGQSVLVPDQLQDRVLAVEARLAARERSRSGAQAELLRDVLALAAELEPLGYGGAVIAQLALVLDCSEYRAAELLTRAQCFADLPGGMEQLAAGALTEEQARLVAERLSRLAPDDAARVWGVLLDRLAAERSRGIAHPPARLRELLERIVAELLPSELADQRARNRPDNGVSHELNDDGTGNLHALGMTAPNLQAALANIAARAGTLGAWDTRSADQRRLDALVDLLTGRTTLGCPEHPARPGGPDDELDTTCGCPIGTPVPCGAQVAVLVPLATALGVSDVPAVLGDGKVLDVELLAQLLRNGPQLTAAVVDEHGNPVAVSDGAVDVVGWDEQALREALVGVARAAAATASEGERFPAHPQDHPPPDDLPPDDDPPPDGHPPGGPPLQPAPAPPPSPSRAAGPCSPSGRDDEAVLAAATLGAPLPEAAARRPPSTHPADAAGPYTVRARLRRLVMLRAPRCEWPGCGARALRPEQVGESGRPNRCDVDHDVAHPDGPTCTCNVGTLCRHHHRVKQLGWRKTRNVDGSVTWTSPTGSSWTSPRQTPDVPRRLRPLPPLPDDLELALLEEHRRVEDDLWLLEHAPEPDSWRLGDPAQDPHAESDRTGERIRRGQADWLLQVSDPYRWLMPDSRAALDALTDAAVDAGPPLTEHDLTA